MGCECERKKLELSYIGQRDREWEREREREIVSEGKFVRVRETGEVRERGKWKRGGMT
jgi:hypothetical protein